GSAGCCTTPCTPPGWRCWTAAGGASSSRISAPRGTSCRGPPSRIEHKSQLDPRGGGVTLLSQTSPARKDFRAWTSKYLGDFAVLTAIAPSEASCVVLELFSRC